MMREKEEKSVDCYFLYIHPQDVGEGEQVRGKVKEWTIFNGGKMQKGEWAMENGEWW